MTSYKALWSHLVAIANMIGYYTLGAGGRGTLEWDETRWAPQPIKANSPLSIETKFLYSRPQLLPLTKRNVTLGYFVTHIFSSIG